MTIKNRVLYLAKTFSEDYLGAVESIERHLSGYGHSLDQPLRAPRNTLRKDAILITYGDQISDGSEDTTPLATQEKWLAQYCEGSIHAVHILPFFPSSSDDGFAVVDYRQVNPTMGTWQDIQSFGQRYSLMFDLVVNHCSKSHTWFKDYLSGEEYAQGYFVEVDKSREDVVQNLEKVTRPRALPLTHKYAHVSGDKSIWTTFSEDQVDLNYGNAELLGEMVGIMFYYISQGAKYLRLDAITFAIKKLGTNCATLPETHSLVKLLRLLAQEFAPGVVIVTETNVPHRENISYFGDSDEGQIVYNFALPTLLIHAILRQNAKVLVEWVSALDTPPSGCAYLNITATHDGIGVRGASEVLPSDETLFLKDECLKRGGEVLERINAQGVPEVYELNITIFDMLLPSSHDLGSAKGRKEVVRRFMLSQYFSFALTGIPGVYFHNLLGSRSWHQGYEKTKMVRTLNRKKFTREDLDVLLADPESHTSAIFNLMNHILEVYHTHDVFGLDADQKIYLVEGVCDLVALIRIYPDRGSTVRCYFNFSGNERIIPKEELQIFDGGFYDLISGKKIRSDEDVLLTSWETVWLYRDSGEN